MKPKIFSFTCNMFDILTKKNDILRICVEENMVKILENWSHCIRIQQKKSTYKRELALQREVRACPSQLKFRPIRFLQQYVQGLLTGSQRCEEVMVNMNKI